MANAVHQRSARRRLISALRWLAIVAFFSVPISALVGQRQFECEGPTCDPTWFPGLRLLPVAGLVVGVILLAVAGFLAAFEE